MAAVVAGTHQSMNGGVGVVEVTTIRIRTDVASRVNRLLTTPWPLEIGLRDHRLSRGGRRGEAGLAAQVTVVRGAGP